MNRTDRLVALVMLLQSRRVITAAEMASHFEITERTVYRDLAALGESGVPIVGEPGVGYSLMRGYHLPPVMFSPQEAFALVTGSLLAERMTDDSVREPMRTALGKLTAILPADVQGRVQRLSAGMTVRIRKPGAGPVPLSRLQLAMADRRVLRIEYAGASRAERTTRDIEPLGLVFYLDHWHLFAWCQLREEVRDFRADRIQRCEMLAHTCTPRPGFDLTEHLTCWHSTEVADIASLEVHPVLLETIRRQWGPALLSEKTLGGQAVLVELAVREVTYLARWLLAFGDKVKVLGPPKLKREIVSAARRTLAHHEGEKRTRTKHS